jgi:hypothetical protein
MSYDPVEALRSAGHPVDILSTAQRGVLAELTESEVATLNSIKTRLDSSGAGLVEGQHTFIFIL